MGFRTLAAVLAGLAILAGALNVGLAAQASAVSAAHGAVGAPCSDCDDCGKVPCSMPMADCVLMHAGATPAMIVATVDLPASRYVVVHWTPAESFLSGLSPPPDPFPPRA